MAYAEALPDSIAQEIYKEWELPGVDPLVGMRGNVVVDVIDDNTPFKKSIARLIEDLHVVEGKAYKELEIALPETSRYYALRRLIEFTGAMRTLLNPFEEHASYDDIAAALRRYR